MSEPALKKPVTGSRIGCDQSPDVQLNMNVRGLPASATVALNERSDRLRSEGRRIFKMGLGQSPFPVPSPVVEALRQNAHQKAYLPVKGLPELRAAVAEHHCRTLGIDTTPEDVLVGPGSKELMFILQLVYYGDLVISSPSWVSYAPQAQILGRRVHFLHTRAEEGWRITPEQLDGLCRVDPTRPRILILNYPSNPTGTSYSADQLGELAELSRSPGWSFCRMRSTESCTTKGPTFPSCPATPRAPYSVAD